MNAVNDHLGVFFTARGEIVVTLAQVETKLTYDVFELTVRLSLTLDTHTHTRTPTHTHIYPHIIYI